MRTLLLFIFLLLSTRVLLSQNLTVLDSISKEPLEYVSIISENPREMISTNMEGSADISMFKNSDEIIIQYLGYKKLITSYERLKEKAYKIYLKPTEFNLNQVVISANRWKQSSSKVPQKITKISSKEVALQNPQTTADLLSISGNVFIQKSQQGGGSPMIRGFATNRLLYSVDGVRMNNAIFRSGNIQNVISLDAFSIESTEILFGPSSVIYGSDAIGGVMSFQTLTPSFSKNKNATVSGKALTRYSTANNERTGHFHIGVGWKKFAFVSSFSSYEFDNLRQGSNGPDDYIKPFFVSRIDSSDKVVAQEDELIQRPSAYSQINLMQKVRYKPKENWDIQYGFHYSETSPYGRYDRHNRLSGNQPRYGEWNYGPQIWMMNNLQINHRATNIFFDKMSVRLAQQKFKESRIDRDFNDINRRLREEGVDAYSLNIDLSKSIGEKHRIFYGFEYIINDVNSNGKLENIANGSSSDAASRYPDSQWSSLALYLNNEFSLNEKTTIQGGLRINQYSLESEFDTTFYPFPFQSASINNSALTGSIGLVYRPSKSWVLSSNFGTAFRSPNVDDIGKVFDSEPGSVVVPNPNLSAEYAYNIDFSVAKIFNSSIKLELTAFYTLLENAMVRRDFALNNQDSIIYDGSLSKVQAIQNAANARVYGVQSELEVKLNKGFSVSTYLSYQIGEEELDDGSVSPSRHAAPLFGVSRFNYMNNNLSLQLYVEYQSERKFEDLAIEEQSKIEIYALDNNGKPYSPAWYSLGFKALYKINRTFNVSSGIENITDQRYRPYSSGISAPGRNFIFSLSAQF